MQSKIGRPPDESSGFEGFWGFGGPVYAKIRAFGDICRPVAIGLNLKNNTRESNRAKAKVWSEEKRSFEEARHTTFGKT
jgi:hypothetical protein